MNGPAAARMNDAAAIIASLPPRAAKMVAIEILLADPESLGDDILESCLYILRDKLTAETGSAGASVPEDAAPAKSRPGGFPPGRGTPGARARNARGPDHPAGAAGAPRDRGRGAPPIPVTLTARDSSKS
jgi:hypothetical protein